MNPYGQRYTGERIRTRASEMAADIVREREIPRGIKDSLNDIRVPIRSKYDGSREVPKNILYELFDVYPTLLSAAVEVNLENSWEFIENISMGGAPGGEVFGVSEKEEPEYRDNSFLTELADLAHTVSTSVRMLDDEEYYDSARNLKMQLRKNRENLSVTPVIPRLLSYWILNIFPWADFDRHSDAYSPEESEAILNELWSIRDVVRSTIGPYS